MGIIQEEITLRNAIDVGNCKRGLIKEHEIRQKTIKALVDTGAGTLVINDAIRRELGLEIQGERRATLANDTKEVCKVTEPVEVHWKNRFTAVSALVVSGDGMVLLGAIPLEDLDLIVDPAKQELIGAHGDEVLTMLKQAGSSAA